MEDFDITCTWCNTSLLKFELNLTLGEFRKLHNLYEKLIKDGLLWAEFYTNIAKEIPAELSIREIIT